MSKNLRAFRCGANILGYNIDSINYVMTCAWAMMIDYDKIAMLIGSQSITGQNLKKDMKVGVSSLALGQESIAKIIGSTHSDEVDKLKDISYENKDGMILINDSKVCMECKVLEIKNIEEDYLVFLKVENFKENNELEFLDGYNPQLY